MVDTRYILPAVIRQESGGNPMALSPKGAAGVMQIMPDTARNPGFGVAPLQGWDGRDPRTAPVEEQIRFGNDYLNALANNFGGDVRMALAAYNAGPRAVTKYGGVPPYKETQDYVNKVSASAPPAPAASDWRSRAEAASAPSVQPPQSDWRSRAQPAASDWRSRAEAAAPAAPVNDPASNMGGAAAGLQGFNSVIPFGERIVAGLGAAGASAYNTVTGAPDPGMPANYDQIREMQRVTREENSREYYSGMGAGIVNSLLLGDLGGGVAADATTTGIRGVVNEIPKALSSVGNWVRGSKVAKDAGVVAKTANIAGKSVRGAVVAAPTAGLYSYGASEHDLNSGSALQDALVGGGVGAAVGAALPVAGAALSAGITKLADKFAARAGRAAGEIPATLPTFTKEEQKIYDRLLADYGTPEKVREVLNSYRSSPEQALIERGGANTRNLGEAAGMFPSGSATAEKFFKETTEVAGDKLKQSVRKNISTSENLVEDLDKVVAEGRAAASPLYKQAFAENASVQSPLVDRILKTPEGRAALSDAVKNMQNEMTLVAESDPELTALAREAGLQATGNGVASGLKLRTLDYVKRALDDAVDKAVTAGDRAEYRRINNLRKGLVAELDRLDKGGAYAKARSVSGDYLSSKAAMEAGLDFLKADSEQLAKQMGAYSPSEVRAYRAGAARAIRKEIDRKFDGQNVARFFTKNDNRLKLQSVLSPTQYEKLRKDAEALDNIYSLRNQVTRGSASIKRGIAAEEFSPEAQNFIQSMVTKSPTQALLDTGALFIARHFKGLSDSSAGEVARMLFATEPQAKYEIVKKLTQLSKVKTPEGLEAAKKLKAFYKIADFVSFNKGKTPAALVPQMLTSKPRSTP